MSGAQLAEGLSDRARGILAALAKSGCPGCGLARPAHLITCILMGIDAVTAAPVAPGLQPCGTFAAYQRHMRKGQNACPPCADAALWHGRAQRAFRRLEGSGRK